MKPPEYTVGDTKPLTGSVGMATTGAQDPAVHLRLPDQTVTPLTGTWTDEATGAWSADWPTGGVPDVPGSTGVEVQVTFSDGKIQTVAGASIYIRQQIA